MFAEVLEDMTSFTNPARHNISMIHGDRNVPTGRGG